LTRNSKLLSASRLQLFLIALAALSRNALVAAARSYIANTGNLQFDRENCCLIFLASPLIPARNTNTAELIKITVQTAISDSQLD